MADDRKTQRDRDLLLKSIDHWQRMKEDPACREVPFEDDCPLCRVYVEDECGSCPVAVETTQGGCKGTPWSVASSAWDRRHISDFCWSEWQAAADAEIAFLQSLIGKAIIAEKEPQRDFKVGDEGLTEDGKGQYRVVATDKLCVPPAPDTPVVALVKHENWPGERTYTFNAKGRSFFFKGFSLVPPMRLKPGDVVRTTDERIGVVQGDLMTGRLLLLMAGDPNPVSVSPKGNNAQGQPIVNEVIGNRRDGRKPQCGA